MARNKVEQEVSEELSTPAHEGRTKESKRKQKPQAEVLESWYEFVPAKTHEQLSKKGRTLVRKQRTENGVLQTWVGHEKKIPQAFLARIKKEGSLRG